MQKKQVALAVVGAFAGLAATSVFAGVGGISVSGVRTYATEALTASSTVQVATPSLAYSLTNPFAANTLPIIKLSLDNGAKFFTACPTLTVNKDSANLAVVIPTSAATGTINATTGVVTCIYQPAAALVNSVPTNATLDFTPATSTIGSLSGLTPSSPISGTVAVFDAGGNPANDGNTAILVRAADSLAITATNSAVFTPLPEISKINISAATNSGLTFTAGTAATDVTGISTSLINIGSVTVSEVAGQQFDGQATPVEVLFANMGAGKEALSIDVTGTFQVGSKVELHSAAGCGAAIAGTLVTVTAATSSKVSYTAVDTSTVAAASGAKTVFICYTNAGTAAGTPQIPTSQFAVSGKFVGQTAAAANLAAKNLASTNLYNLVLDAAQVDLRQFWSQATSNANGGWVQIIRIINTSNVAANISGQYIAESTGAAVGTPTVMTSAAVPAGAVVTFLGSDVETKIGAAPAGIHRLRITAPVNSLRVQSFLRDPRGAHLAIADQGVEGGAAAATGEK